MIIDPNDKSRFKGLFSNWVEVGEQRKALNDANKEIVKEVSDILNVKAKTVNKLFRFLKEKQDNGDDELDLIIEITNSLGV